MDRKDGIGTHATVEVQPKFSAGGRLKELYISSKKLILEEK